MTLQNQATSLLKPFFNKTRGKMIPGAYRLQKLLVNWLDQGILNLPSVLITGSNGKGTTCAFIESILRASGFKTGLYTSPHLIHPAERIRINGIPINDELLETTIIEITKQADIHLPDASFFEILTAVGFLIFFKEKIDFLICEVGLGGYEDSTNATSPIVSAITSISLEHTEILGDSLYQIGKDKAFVARRNRPIVVASQIPLEAKNGIFESAEIFICKRNHQ
jgi:dihydrofolate synthase/folylpolyglutamate synthase